MMKGSSLHQCAASLESYQLDVTERQRAPGGESLKGRKEKVKNRLPNMLLHVKTIFIMLTGI